MQVEMNGNLVKDNPPLKIPSGGTIMVTPPIDDSYWVLRVPVSENQAVVAFPKFGTIGIGFQHEEDWNTNLPYTCDAQEIFDHISRNKGSRTILDADCVTAIEMLQEAIKSTLVNNPAI